MNDNRKDIGPIMREFDRVLSGQRLQRQRDNSIPSVGSNVLIDGRQFEALKIEPYRRKRDGAESWLVTWRGHCATCGAPYDVKGSRHASHLPKNCEAHRGRRTKRARRRHPAREIIARAYVAIQNGDIERARKLLANEMKRKPEIKA
jgi:hypothetical protein